ncbi:MAG: hypothetical protein O2954_16900, partial [bacterium]|nr:hypothetical protein [bacterium]
MENEKKDKAEAVSQLGGTPEGRVQRYFCMDDTDCQAFSRVSKDVRVVKRTPKRVRIMGQEVDGWIVEIV